MHAISPVPQRTAARISASLEASVARKIINWRSVHAAIGAALAASAWAVAAGWQPSEAHHYMAEFDRTKEMKLTGVVKEWQWINPHTWLIIDVKGADGKTVEWALEGVAPSGWKQRGIRKDIFAVGQEVTLQVAPRKDGRAEGGISGILTINGKPGPGVIIRGANE